jgi:hypothetical protein
MALAAHSGFKNDGFSDNASGSAVQGAGLIPLVGVGYGIKVDLFRAALMVSHAFTSIDSPVDYSSLSGFLTVGVDLPLFGAHADATPAQPAPPK